MNKNYHKYIVVFLSILAFFLCLVPLFLSRAIPIICENLSYNTQYNVTVKNPKVYLNVIPVVTLKADDISVKSKSSDEFYNIKNLRLKIRILPLISGRVHINKISTDSVDIKTKINEDIALDKDFVSSLSDIKLICNNVNLNDIKINISQENKKQNINLTSDNISYANTRRYLRLYSNSILKINDKNSDIKIDLNLPKNNDIKKSKINIELTNFDINPLSEFFRSYLPKDLKLAKGMLDLKINNKNLNAEIRNTGIIMNDDAKSIIFPAKLNINSELSITGKDILIKDAKITSANINTIINGKISDFMKNRIPVYDVNVLINKSRIEDFISMLPIFKTEDIDSYKLKKYKFYGDIIGNLTIKGKDLEPSVTGDIFVNNGILTKPIPNASGATVKLNFKGKYLNFDVNVPAGGSEKVLVKGGVELYNVKYADMRVWSTKNVDLATAEDKVVPLHEILNFVIGPVPIMNIKGRGNIDITIKGNRKNPHVWGGLNFYDVTTHFFEIPDLILSNADAVLTFDDENAVFTLNKGQIDGKNILLKGVCNLAGKFDFDVQAEGQKLAHLYKSIKTSASIVNDIKTMIPDLDSSEGLANLKLKVYGNIKDIEYVKFNENFFVKGTLELLNNIIESKGVKITSVNGKINFDNTNADLMIKALIGKSPLDVKALIKNDYADANIIIPNLNLKDIIPNDDKFKKDIADINVDLNAKYKGSASNIEYDKIDFSAKILNVAKNNKLRLSNGLISYTNGKLQIKNIKGKFTDTNSSFDINMQGQKLNENPVFSGHIVLKEFELGLLNMFGTYDIVPQNIRKIINTVNFERGKISSDIKISNNNVNASTNIGGVEFVYRPIELPIKIVNGSLYIRKNYLGLNKINLMADDMPILIDGGVDNIFSKQDFNIYINSKPKQDFVDKYFNNNRIYPLKIKGDIVYSAKFKGEKDNFDCKAEANLAKDSSIYYLGATIGDIENAIILNLNMNVLKQKFVKVKEFSYDKLIESQGKRVTRLNMVKAFGGFELLNEDLIFRELRVKTSNPTDARIFNILFRKPNIKQGQFTSDLRFNGKLSNPHLIGNFHIVETDIPFLDTTMKNLSFNFKDKTIELKSTGEILGNDVKFKGTLRNKLTPPYYIENAELYTKIIDFNNLINRLKSSQVNETNAIDTLADFDIKNTVIKSMKINADAIKLRNLTASGVQANISLSEKKVFNVDKFKFDVADGDLHGNFKFDLIKNDTGITLSAKNINANDMSIALFNLDNQIYGSLTGQVNLSCNGAEFNKCMETLNGKLTFNVKDGRMPKLGSLEYLLKAGNLLKGGITGLSINSVIDILTPLKTGNFSDIYGTMTINKGVTDNIEISTRGKDLSLFITGKYNFSTSEAQMEVLGLLSKKISTMFGPLGNVSLNTLFNVVPGVDLAKDSYILDKINKIPGIELSSKAFRKFIAEIDGNINSENYVKSFSWIN